MRLGRLAIAFVLGLHVLPARCGAQVVLVPTFSVASSGFGETDQPWSIVGSDAVVDASGGVLFFWSEVFPNSSHLPRALVSRHLSAGVLGPYVRYGFNDEFVRNPAVGARPFDGFVTAWQSDRAGPSFERKLFARFRDPAGEPAGEVIEVASEDLLFGPSIAVVGLPIGGAFAWFAGQNEVHGRVFRADGRSQTPAFTIGTSPIGRSIGMAAVPEVGFVVGWSSENGTDRGGSAGRVYVESGTPLGDAFSFSELSSFLAVAVSPTGDVIAALGGRGNETATSELWLRRTTLAGVPLGDEVLVATGAADGNIRGDLPFDWNGNLHVVWSDISHGATPTFARGYDVAGQPLGAAIPIDARNGFNHRTMRLPDGAFVNSLGRYGLRQVDANVTSLCTPGTSVCGDGTRDPLCERCDDGALNSDTAPDACRTDCRPAQCGDGVVDAGEACDDGNRARCDGCDRDCGIEIGLGCGDGIAFPSCGELCDDGNAMDGDGCSACMPERVPGGGAAKSDCYAEWSVDNTANLPRYDKHGAINASQTCVDDDPRCDFDGGVPGSCTFAVDVCVNNTNLPACDPEFRVLQWELRKPSASKALSDPLAAAVRNAFAAVVPGAVVGPDARDLCSPHVMVTLPPKGTVARPKPRKLTLVTRTSLYSGATDADKLRLVCLPAAP
jgi:cysteine-rich repeat protein